MKEYVDKLMKMVSQVRLLGKELSKRRIMEKVLISLTEKFESKISSLKDSEDLSKLTLVEVIKTL